MRRFAASLARCRRQAGFPTPYAFYRRNGGRRVFPFTFPYYLKIERGQSLPRPEWVPLLIGLMRIQPTEEGHRRLTLDYLRDLCGKEEAFHALIAPLLCTHTRNGGMAETIKRLLYGEAYHLSPLELEAVASSEGAYWSFECLGNERRPLSPVELAGAAGLSVPKVREGLRVLAARRLVRRTKGGRYKSVHVGRMSYPPPQAGDDRSKARIQRYLDAMSRRRGEGVLGRRLMFRAEESAVRRAAPGMVEAMESAAAQSVYEKGEETGLYLLECRVRRLFRF